jgi:curved DNA-binding protein CbpA
MQQGPFIDYYEVLQVSPNADQETIQRVYRILAQRFHPDNRDTGNEDAFRRLSEAYAELGDPERRGGYDVRHREERRLTWKIFDQTHATQGAEGEKRKRLGILQLLYRKRLVEPAQPTMTLHEFEDLLGVPKEHLEFSLWYLREGQYVNRADNGKHTITLKGVDLAETLAERREAAPMLLGPVRASTPTNVRAAQG